MLQDFSRYLSAKKTVDDRCLNRWVYQQLQSAVAAREPSRPLSILEIGCGIGTMIERLWDWNLTPTATYTAIDREAGLIVRAQDRLSEFAQRRHLVWQEKDGEMCWQGEGKLWSVRLKVQDLFDLLVTRPQSHTFDLLIAHAVLDLLDLEECLPRLLALLRPGGLYYFTLNFDGVTIFQPALEEEFEAAIIELYHLDMDKRLGGHSQTGRRLLEALQRYGCHILAAGSSDWLVWPTPSGSYPADEAFFLQCILDFIAAVLEKHPDLKQKHCHSWLARRRAQIAAGELIFLAHQIDVCGRSGSDSQI